MLRIPHFDKISNVPYDSAYCTKVRFDHSDLSQLKCDLTFLWSDRTELSHLGALAVEIC